MRAASVLWFSLLVLVSHAACSSDEGGSPGTGGTQSGTTFGSSACGSCFAQACQAERSGCLTDPGCASFVECLDACGLAADGNVDPTCVAGCPSPTSSAGESAKNAVETCRTSAAGATCPSCGADAGGDADAASSTNPILAPQNCTPSGIPGCSGCIDDHCCKLTSECVTDPECKALSACVAACNDWDCESGCYTSHASAVAKYSSHYACVAIFCPGTDADCQKAPNAVIECVVTADCKTQYADCYADADCYLVTQCAMECPNSDTACYEACKNDHPGGVTAWGAMTLCWEQKCSYAM